MLGRTFKRKSMVYSAKDVYDFCQDRTFYTNVELEERDDCTIVKFFDEHSEIHIWYLFDKKDVKHVNVIFRFEMEKTVNFNNILMFLNEYNIKSNKMIYCWSSKTREIIGKTYFQQDGSVDILRDLHSEFIPMLLLKSRIDDSIV